MKDNVLSIKADFSLKKHALRTLIPLSSEQANQNIESYNYSNEYCENSAIKPTLVVSRNGFIGIKEKDDEVFHVFCRWCTKKIRPTNE